MRKYHVPWRDYFLLDVNPVVRFMILSDFVWMGSVGLLVPIFALFVEDSVVGGNAAIVGIAASIYLITKSVVQIVAASVIDWIKGEFDDFWVMFIFSFLAAILPIAYLFMETPIHLFLIQFVYGILMAFTFPTFMAMFSRHLDRKKAGTEWGIYYTFNDLGSAFTAFMGGVIATLVGFNTLVIVSVVASAVGVLFLYPIRLYLYVR
jgi:MFS family permease